MKRFLIVIWGDCDPEVFGPYDNRIKRDNAAKGIRKEHGDKHGIYPAYVDKNGNLIMDSYSGAFFEEGKEDEA